MLGGIIKLDILVNLNQIKFFFLNNLHKQEYII